MSERRGGFGYLPIAVIPIVCCVGLPLLAAAGAGVAALVGGLGAAVVALIVAAVLLRSHIPGRRERT